MRLPSGDSDQKTAFPPRLQRRIDQGFQAEALANLRHLGVRAADVDRPAEPRPRAHDLLLPAQPLDAHLGQGLAAGEIDRRLQEEGVDQFDAAFLDPLLELLEPLGQEVRDGNHVVALGHDEAVVGIVADPVEMVQVGIGAVIPLDGPVCQPTAACRMEVRHDEGRRQRNVGPRDEEWV